MRAPHPKTSWRLLPCAVLLAGLCGQGAPSTAAGEELTPLVRLWQATSIEVVDGSVYCGTNDGGVLSWRESDPDNVEHLLAGTELTSAAIADISWTGRHLWIATGDGGMTRVADPGGAAVFDFFSTSLRTSAVSAVAGHVTAEVEKVWYGAVGQGLGEIIGNQPGALYTAETDGLISNDIRDLAVHEEALFVATPSGVSRFVGGVFTDEVAGLTDLDVRVLALDANGDLLAGGAGGVHRWDAPGETWVHLGDVGRTVVDLAVHGSEIYALGALVNTVATLHRWNTTAFEPVPRPRNAIEAIGAGSEFWLAGRYPAPGRINSVTFPMYRSRHDTGDTYTIWVTEESPVPQPMGVTFGADERIWVSDIQGQTFAARNGDGTWSGVYQFAADAPDSSGIINRGKPMLFMTTGVDGTIWTSQLGNIADDTDFGGVMRHDPDSWHTDAILETNSGLAADRVINGVTHPDGPIIFLFDNDDNSDIKVQVLVEPGRWRDSSSWLTIPDEFIGGTRAVDALVERRDVLWLAIWGTGGGVLRWDINGLSAGPDDPLTWHDLTDDLWGPRINFFPGAPYDPEKVEALDMDASGTIWTGGNGLVGFRFDERFNEVTTVADFGAKTPDTDGLISSNVTDVAVDRNGYVWVVTAGGLNRVRPVGNGHAIDAWFDVVTYSANTDLGILYSPSRISSMTGVDHTASRLVASPAGDRLLLSSSRGVTVIEAGGPVGGGDEDGSGLYLYPNPWLPDGDVRLALGGIPADSNELLAVGVYNLEGQLVYRDDEVSLDTGFWSGNNRVGEPVTTGMYLVRVSWRGNTILRTLAVVR